MRKRVWLWYLRQDDKEYGPLSHKELLLIAGLGKLRSQDRLRGPGFPTWVSPDFIPGLLKPPLILSMLTLGGSWEPTLRRCRASWLRTQARAASLLQGFSPRLAIKLPAAWLGAGSVLAVIIIGTSTQNSESSFAIVSPPLSKAKPSVCDPAPQVHRVTTIPLPPASPIDKEIQLSENNEAAEATPISLTPASPTHEDIQVSEHHEEAEATERVPAFANLSEEDAVTLPMRKPVVEAPLRNIDTKAGARSVQHRLRNLGYLTADAEGSWGPRSRIALKHFQLRANLARGNGWDRRTERVLFSRKAPRATSIVPSPFAQALF